MSRLKALIVVVFFISLVSSSNTFADEKLRVSAINWPPYFIYDEHSEASGIVSDVLAEVKKRLNVELEIIKLPQKRMVTYFRSGELDIDPTSSKVWREADKDVSLYTIPYLKVQKVIFVKHSTEITGDYINDFQGKTLGSILGYHHNFFVGKAFDDQLVDRKDSRSHDINLKLLKADRIDGLIIERQAAKYWISQLNDDIDAYKEAYDAGPAIDISMRIHKSQAALLPKLNRVLTEMIAEGFIKNAVAIHTKTPKAYIISENDLAD
ncbi:transporter substrate-binding domain-containing protein [Cocleimonas sp. KMM 6892]|uniref:substrate-binding periplasmic protein n=1 Tax=unclassified Cocleimonas TaxID=2639732 RepID=UPI002DB98903|nr:MULTISPECIES: transporter substrate-binding domain-containing protein [unclassified Cocleimonas]MEB8432088.1 transporter substrate-binding domain-containing protein [Cocleimonas sp. KMM 6892]MEC4714826.1 transporter substrate-binding domain-containing protein [Cocleimonas sp. KMM 6895]MEC4744360.1 transporter substrate-binding domain-containing protein [Cocleimonas sp. KMM 6896]